VVAEVSLKAHLKYLVLPGVVVAAAFALHGGMYEGPFLRASAHVAALAALMYAIFAWTARWPVVRAIIGILIAGEILVRVAYGSSISIIVLMSVVNTNPYLTSSFLLEYAAECLILILFVVAVTWAPVPKHSRLTAAATVLGIGYLAVPMFEGSDGVFGSDIFKGHRQTARARGFSDAYARFDYVVSHMSRRFPPMSWVVAIPDTVQFARLAEDSESSWSDVSASARSPRLLVLGIGESLRAANLSLYGYFRQTTPELVRRSNEIHIYKHAYAGGTNSWNALPAMLTLFQGSPDFSKSIMYLARDAGYKTYWLSNHPKYSAYDFSISAIANQADHVYFAADEFGDGAYDEVLVPKLEKILRDAADDDDRHLVVVHFMGSHLRFHERYPESFSRFTGGAKELDRYDNSVLYSDFVQDQVLDLVQKYGAEYLFFADHGLGHPEGAYPLKHDVRETPAVDSLHVPFFATSKEALRFDADDTVSLFFFECVFARWSGISARALEERDYCDSSLGQSDITFLDSNVRINTQGVFN
jgi:glucan phosphoethanolaminetransferase (alkaline phosphatase superfamily)